MKINLLPKNEWKQTLWKAINVVSSIALVFNMSMIGVFMTPKVARADVGSITLDGISHVSSNVYKAWGKWDPTGNQCWTPGGGGTFHYKVFVYDDTNGNGTYDIGEKLTQVVPAACNEDYTSPVDNANRNVGGNWPAISSPNNNNIPQPDATFPLTPGNHTICAVLIHVNNQGQDIAEANYCYGQEQEAGLISGYKWNDENGDTNWNGAEPALPNWDINLSGISSGTDTTDSDGYYEFNNLNAGNYTTSEVLQNGWNQTFPSAPGTHSITLDCGDIVTGKNFGNKISAYCGDGIVNDGEECDGQAGVPEHYICTNDCTLEYVPWCGDGIVNQPSEECDGDEPMSCETAEGYQGWRNCQNDCTWTECEPYEYCGDGEVNDGDECDDGINNGNLCTPPYNDSCTYCSSECTEITLNGPYCGDGDLNEPYEECDDGNNVDGDGCNASCITEYCGDRIKNGPEECDGTDGVDYGQSCSLDCQLLGSIQGFKFDDTNCDGIKACAENTVPNWPINLTGPVSLSTNTNFAGSYKFSDLPDGVYTVTEGSLSGWTPTSPTSIDNLVITDGTVYTYQNFGNFDNMTMSGHKWYDLNGDGVWQKDGPNAEPAIPNWPIYLYEKIGDNWTLSQTTNTDVNGYYSFEITHCGRYYIEEAIYPDWTPATVTRYYYPDGILIQSGHPDITDLDFGNFQLATLKVFKQVIKDNGGQLDASDFTMNVTGTNVSDPSFPGDKAGTTVTLNPGSYSVDEEYVPGYTKTLGVNCSGTILNGENKTCTITNDDIAPTITLYKEVINDDGGNAGVNDFGLTIGATGVNSGDTLDVMANTPIALDEAGLSGYAFVSLTGDPKCPSVLGGTATLDEGENITCTITNEDIAPTITLNKVVNNNHGGNAGVNDFGLTIGATGVNSGDTLAVNANEAIALNEAGLSGYSFVSLTGDPKCPSVLGGTATLDEGENITCTITNEDVAPTLTLIKYVTNDNGGTKVVADFPLFIGGNQVTSGVANQVMANVEYTATETADPGYTASAWGGDCSEDGKITLLPGENKTCTITNDDIQPKLMVTKVVINDNGRTMTVNDFPLFVSGNPVTSGVQNNFNAGAYTVSETNQYGYVATISGDCGADGSITLNPGDIKSCTITNDDIMPVLGLTKTAPAQVNAGDNITYTINWSVTGNQTATQVVLWDPIPTNTTFVSADNGGVYDVATKTVTWNLGTKNPGDSGTVHMVVKTNSPLADNTIITNTAYFDSFETDPALQAQAKTEIVSGPILNIVKLDTPDPVKPGENINYTINWSVTGNDKASNVKITDVIPTNTTYVSVADGGVYDAITNTITWTLGDKNPGDSGTVHFVVKTNSPLTNGTVIKNTATIDCDETPPTSADAFTTVIAAPVLKITKSIDKTWVNPGDNANYTVLIENTGNDTAINVKLTDLLPSGFTFTEFGTSQHTWNLGNLAAGAKISITYNVTIGPGVAAGTYENLAVAWADNHGNVTAKAPLEVRVPKVLAEEPKPVLTIDKTVNVEFANPGNIVVYTVRVSNTGEATAINVQLQDVLPAGFTFEGSDNISKTWSLGDIIPGETKQVTYSVKIDDKILAGTYENLAVAWADNHGQVTDFVGLEVRVVKVLAETGPGPIDYLYFFGAGSILLTSLYVLGLTRRKEKK